MLGQGRQTLNDWALTLDICIANATLRAPSIATDCSVSQQTIAEIKPYQLEMTSRLQAAA